MYYAPVVIPTLCRYEHLKVELESLASNMLAKHTDVFVALDFPSNNSHIDGYEKINKYLQEFDSGLFSSLNIIKRDRNYGASANLKKLIDEQVSPDYEYWIVAEDDLEFSPCFLTYMNAGLREYIDDKKVHAVCGYSYPVLWEHSQTSTAFFQSVSCTTWGIGYWRKKEKVISAELRNGYLLDNFDKIVKTKMLRSIPRPRRIEYIAYATMGWSSQLLNKSSDMSRGIYLTLQNQKVLCPVVSKVRNHGFDGSGLYCREIKKYTNAHSQNYNYGMQDIDMSNDYILKTDCSEINMLKNNNKLTKFLYVPFELKLASWLGLMMYKIVGDRTRTIARKVKEKINI